MILTTTLHDIMSSPRDIMTTLSDIMTTLFDIMTTHRDIITTLHDIMTTLQVIIVVSWYHITCIELVSKNLHLMRFIQVLKPVFIYHLCNLLTLQIGLVLLRGPNSSCAVIYL